MISVSRVASLAVWVGIVALGLWWMRQHTIDGSDQEYPSRPIQVVVPFPAGGGTDTFVRIVQKGIAEDNMLDQPLVVINQGGGGGTIGSRTVKNARPDGYKILCLHNGIITAKLSGTVNYGPEVFEPIALTGSMTLLIIVREDSEFQDVNDLVRAAKETPNAVCFGASQGAPAFFAALQLERSLPGASFNIVSSKGGADRYASLIGGHIHAGIFSLSEYLNFLSPDGTLPDQNRNIRAIACLGPERHEAIPEVATCTEQGIPVLLQNANYWWAPKGTPKSVTEKLADVLEKSMNNATVRTELNRLRLAPDYLRAEAFQERLDDTISSFESVVTKQQTSVPNFVPWVAGITGMMLLWTVIESVQVGRSAGALDSDRAIENAQESAPKHYVTAVACFLAVAAYVALLEAGWVPFAVATTGMVLAVGLMMTRGERSQWWPLITIALATGLGLEFVFTQIFVTALP